MMEVCGNLISYDIVKRWCREFLNGHIEIADEPHQGWLNVIKKNSINTMRSLIEENGCIIVKIEQYFWDESLFYYVCALSASFTTVRYNIFNNIFILKVFMY